MRINSPLIMLSVIALTLCIGPLLTLNIKQNLYSISLFIKSIIALVLPIIIFGLLAKATIKMARNATYVAIIILASIMASNFFSTCLSGYIGAWIYTFDLSIMLPSSALQLEPLWSITFPKFIANDKAMLGGIVLGVCAGYFKISEHWVGLLDHIVIKTMSFLSLLIPFFIAGFIIKLQHEGLIGLILKDYSTVFMVIALSQFAYITAMYLVANQGNVKSTMICIKNMLPAAVSGFSTMSSATSLPLTIEGTLKNVKNKNIAQSVIASTVNIHLIGDCIAIPIFAYAVLKNYGVADPTFVNYMIFTCYFVLAKFSVAAIPGGGIIVMLPILESYLGFSAEMMSLITALYILFDPVVTCTNILGNGAFAKLIDSLFSKSSK